MAEPSGDHSGSPSPVLSLSGEKVSWRGLPWGCVIQTCLSALSTVDSVMTKRTDLASGETRGCEMERWWRRSSLLGKRDWENEVRDRVRQIRMRRSTGEYYREGCCRLALGEVDVGAAL